MTSSGAGAVGRRLGRYHLAEPLGGGPTGEVFRAKVYGVAGYERQFAVKRLHPSLVSDPDVATQLAQAARHYGGLEHPRIARLHEFGVAGGETFTAVELVIGVDLGQLQAATWENGSPLALGAAANLVSTASRAVGFAHGRGLAHLGLCPTNVIVTADGELKVTDFGLLPARLPARPAADLSLAARLPYLAPEQLAGEPTSPATDVFQLGLMAVELMTGKRAFAGGGEELARRVLAGEVVAFELPKPVGNVVRRSLARSPIERFPDAGAMADALDAAIRALPLHGDRRDLGTAVKHALEQRTSLRESGSSGALRFPMPSPPAARPGTVPPPASVPMPRGAQAMPRGLGLGGGGAGGLMAATRPAATLPRPSDRAATVPAPTVPALKHGTERGLGDVGRGRGSVAPPIRPLTDDGPTGVQDPPGTRRGGEDDGPTHVFNKEPASEADARFRGPPAARTVMGHVAPTPARNGNGNGSGNGNGGGHGNGSGGRPPGPSDPIRGGDTALDLDQVRGQIRPPPGVVDELALGTGDQPPPRFRLDDTDLFDDGESTGGSEFELQPTSPVSLDPVDDGYEVRADPTPLPAPMPIGHTPPHSIRALTAQPPPHPGQARPADRAPAGLDPLGHAPPQFLPEAPPLLANAPTVERTGPTAKKRSFSPARAALFAILFIALGMGGYVGYELLLAPDEPAAAPPVAKATAPKPAGGSHLPAPAASTGSGTGTGSGAGTGSGTGSGAPAPADADTLTIASKPDGAQVYLDGALVGRTPVELPGSEDRHKLAVILAGYKLIAKEIAGNGKIDLALDEVTPSDGPAGIKVRCKTKDRYYVTVDGADVGQTCPTERIAVDLGPHTVEVYDPVSDSRREYKIVVDQTRNSVRVRVE